MPAKNTKLINGERCNPLSIKLWNSFKKETGIDIPYILFSNIITASNEKIRNYILESISGFKFPESMGYSMIVRFKGDPARRAIDFKKTKEEGVTVYHTNFHSFGYTPRVRWFTSAVSSCKYLDIYKFVPERKLMRGMAAKVKGGKTYSEVDYREMKARKIQVRQIKDKQ